jgi:hypothetical protein
MPLKERDPELLDNDLCLKHIKALLLELEVLIKKIIGLESIKLALNKRHLS